MPLFVQEACSLYVGDDTPNANKRNNLDSIKLPTLEEISATHHAGGAIGAIDISGLGLNPLEATFKQTGWDPQTMSQFGLGRRGRMPFTCYGMLRDKGISNRAIEVKAIMWGRLTRIEGDEFKRGDSLLGHDHTIKEILRYGLWYDGEEKYYYDWETGTWRVDGVDQNADERRILRY
ncbi:phage major tail tube protein [Microvirga sp. RSM25]|uniref:phage major tail tube protein n=1 Tax=Microvirga sp. RSM25 TaxID=3273802 RepID=UPI00384C50B3